MSGTINVQADDLRSFVAAVFQQLGVPEDDAAMAADVLVRADLRGVETHGTYNFTRIYVPQLQAGNYNPRPRIEVVRESSVTALIDGGGGLGLVVGAQAMDRCLAKAQEHGLAVVAVRNSTHYGMASYYSLKCLDHDMIGFSTTNNSGTAIAPTFGIEPMLSTNPFSIVAPAGTEPPFELDMATSVAAHSKVFLHRSKGLKIPVGWGFAKGGSPTDDPQEVLDSGLLAPLGSTPELSSHKGYGLAVAVDILTGVLAGGMYGTLAKRLEAEDGQKRHVSSCHLFAAVRIDCFQDVGRFKADMDDMLRTLKSSAKAEGCDRIYTAGEKEYELEQTRLHEGIPLRPQQVEELHQLGAAMGIPCPFQEVCA